MEVGAVKQAFNNEVILLKKKLNQAKIHVIHKLTRKAKTLTEKKAPDHLKEKLKRKAESAVNEVLIIKKIKARDIAKFIITHTGKLNDYLNKPKVDNDKACARLVLHKSLQDKYSFMRNRFGNIPIKDLFMSRLERRKLKKEAKDQQKNKKKGKEGKATNSAGDWDVEDVGMSDENGREVDIGSEKDNDSEKDIGSDNEISGDESGQSDEGQMIKAGNNNVSDQDVSENDNENVESDDKSDDEAMESDEVANEPENDSSDDDDQQVGKLIKLKPELVKPVKQSKLPKSVIDKIEVDFNAFKAPKQANVKEKKIDKKVKENKNKNLKEKLQNRKFKKDKDDADIEGRKVVDPFFITSTGENYLSLAEPRQPDEIKEVHKQGNRQERRAAMFGRKFKPRNNFRENNFRSNNFDEGNDSRHSARSKNDRFNKSEDFNDRNSKFSDRNGKFNDRNSKFNDGNSKFNDRNSKFINKDDRFYGNVNNRNDDQKEEKLHPSWEAKRKLKSMALLPSQGKKIVFNDN